MEPKLIVKHLSETDWDNASETQISAYKWLDNAYEPKVVIKMFYNAAALHIKFQVFEQSPRVVYKQHNQDVYKDSCVEFFLMPLPDNDRYMNFEMNAAGVLLFEIGSGRNDRSRLDFDFTELFAIKSSLTFETAPTFEGSFWTVEYNIPLSFIQSFYNMDTFAPGMSMRGNFYKCGDDTATPHYGVWSDVKTDELGFHNPNYFGKITLG